MPKIKPRPLVRRPRGRDLTAHLLTAAEAAALTGYSVGTIHYHIERGILPAWQRGPIFLIPRDELLEWQQAKQAEKAERAEARGG